MTIDTSNWGEFRVGDLFSQVYNAIATTKSDVVIYPIQKVNTIPFVSRTDFNNGCNGYVSINDVKGIENENAIIIGDTTATVFYYGQKFVCGDHIIVLRANWLNTLTGLFIVSILKNDKYRYSYGRAFQKDVIINTRILLPKTQDSQPDWDYMEQFMESLNWANIKTKNKKTDMKLDVENWKEFRLCDIFDIKGGYYNKKPEHSISGNIPFLGATDNDNGTTEFYSIEDIKQWDKQGKQDNSLTNKLFNGNCVAVTVDGSVCNAYYQPNEFICSHSISACYLKNYPMNVYIGLFLCSVIMQDKYRWSYGRKPHDVKKFGQSIIKLPITQDGQPDWNYMEQYIKSLPYGDLLN